MKYYLMTNIESAPTTEDEGLVLGKWLCGLRKKGVVKCHNDCDITVWIA